jgi:hypothetical protein
MWTEGKFCSKMYLHFSLYFYIYTVPVVGRFELKHVACSKNIIVQYTAVQYTIVQYIVVQYTAV